MVGSRVRGFGVEIGGLPGSWPPTHGPVRTQIRWTVEDAVFEAGGDWWFREIDNGLVVRFNDEGEYRVETKPGPFVSVTLGPASEQEAALSFVLAVLPLALPLFGLEPFHGAALELSRGSALLVLGSPEAGKSTTAAALLARGLGFLADDACAIDADGLLWPGPPLLSARSFREGHHLFASYDGKSVVAIPGHDGAPRPVAASAALRPAPGASLEVRSLTGRDAIVALLEQVRSPWVMPERRQRPQFHAAATLARHPVGIVSYEPGRHSPEEVAEAVLTWANSSPNLS